MLLVSPRLNSAGGRHRAHLRLPPCATPPVRPARLACGFVNAAGRGRNGQKTIWSKGARYATRKYRTSLQTPQGGRFLGLVCGLAWQAPIRRALALVKNSVGAWFYAPAVEGLAPLSYFSVVPRRPFLQAIKDFQPTWWWPLALLAPYTRASLFPTRWGQTPRLVRAPGSTALVLSARLWRRWALVILPSGQLFLSRNEPYVLLGGVAPSERYNAFCGTAGAARRRGFAPQVRGVAQNPNDHPHGGRTKAVKYPRTPWGRTTKWPRPPRPRLKLKALAKRKPE